MSSPCRPNSERDTRATDDSEVQYRLHELFHPLMRRAVSIVHFALAPQIRVKKSKGWKGPRTVKLDAACMRTADRIAKSFPELGTEAQSAFDLACLFADLEREHFWTWLGYLLEEIEVEGLIYFDKVDGRIKVR